MKIDNNIDEFEALGNDHIGTSSNTPMRSDAFKLSNEDVEKELDRTLELFKQFEFEQDLKQAIEAIEELQKEQEELQEKTDNKEEPAEDLKKKQDELNKKAEELSKDLEKLQEKNEELEEKHPFPDQKEDMQEMLDEMEKSSEEYVPYIALAYFNPYFFSPFSSLERVLSGKFILLFLESIILL